MHCADSVGTRQVLVTLSAVAIFGDQRLLSLNLCLCFLSPHPLIYFFFHWQQNATQHLQTGKQHQQSCLRAGYSLLKKQNKTKLPEEGYIASNCSQALKQAVSDPLPWSYMLCQYLPLLKALHSFSLARLFSCDRTCIDQEQSVTHNKAQPA